MFTRALVVAAAGSSAINRKKSPGAFVGDGDFGHLEGNIATVAHHIRADMLRSELTEPKAPSSSSLVSFGTPAPTPSETNGARVTTNWLAPHGKKSKAA